MSSRKSPPDSRVAIILDKIISKTYYKSKAHNNCKEARMIVTAKITSKGQITLPREVRKLLNVDAGAVVVFEKEDDKVVVRTAKTLREFKGFLKGKAVSADFD